MGHIRDENTSEQAWTHPASGTNPDSEWATDYLLGDYCVDGHANKTGGWDMDWNKLDWTGLDWTRRLGWMDGWMAIRSE